MYNGDHFMKQRLKTKNLPTPFIPTAPTLQMLLIKGSINKEEYKALRSGNRSAILYAFKLNENYIREILIHEALNDDEL